MTLAPVHHEPDPPDEFAGPASLAAALAAVQAELPGIEKSKTAKIEGKVNYKYTYADLAGVSREVLPLLAKHGLAWLTKPTLNGEGKFVLQYSLLHVSGERERGEYPLQTGTPQQTGSAITYARRYCLCAVVGVAPDDDDDGAAAVEAHQDRQTKRNRAQAKAARQPAPQAETGELIDPKSNLMKRLHASLRFVFASRDEGYAFMGDTIGRDITSTSELTVQQAGQVIAALESLGETPPMTGGEAEGDERADH